MSNLNSPVERHYSSEKMYENIIQKLNELGIETDKITRHDISAADEFHVRGAEASQELAKDAGFNKGEKVLDVGCGIGGPARMIAGVYGCKVTGVDLTEEFIRTAKLLSGLVGLNKLTEFIQADATEMPFDDESFDVVWTEHAQMNIENKEKLYSEIHRVLKKDGRFIYYDIFSSGKGPLYFPVPWAENDSLSHLITPPDYDKLLSNIGFKEIQVKELTGMSIEFFKTTFEKISKEGPPKFGINFLMRESAAEKLKNVLRNLLDKNILVQSGIYGKVSV